MVILLMFSLAISAAYFVSKTKLNTARSVPVFAGEEVVVNRASMAHRGIKVIEAVRVPMPPLVAQPLPIVPPAITFKVLPSYPSTVLEKGREGMVLLSVFVGLSGQPEKVEVKSSSGIAELDKSATEAVSQWKFSPAIQGGSALASWFEVPVRFEIK